MTSVRDVAGRSSQEPVLRLVRSLVGVSDAAIRTTPDGRVDAVAVLPEPGAHERQVRLNIVSALMAGFGLALDPARIQVAADLAALRAFGTESTTTAPAMGSAPVAGDAARPAADPPSDDWPAPVRAPVAASPAPSPKVDVPAAPQPPPTPQTPQPGASATNGAHGPNGSNGGVRPNGGYRNASTDGFPIAPPRRVRLAEDVSGRAQPVTAAPPKPPAPPARAAAAPPRPPVQPPPVEPPAAPAIAHAAPHVEPPAEPAFAPPAPQAIGNGHAPQAAPAQPAPTPVQDDVPDPSPRIETAELVTARGISFCRVVVTVGGERYTGVAEVPAGQAGVELVARVTADALRSARFPREPVNYQGAASVDIGGRAYVVATLRAWNGTGFDDLSAVVPVLDSPEEAAALAVLRAAASRNA